jgi:hypothetical protein
MNVKFKEREFNNVNRHEFYVDDVQTSFNVLIDLSDGNQVIQMEVCKNRNDNSYLCWLVIIDAKYNIKLATTSRSFIRAEAIVTAFEKAQISFEPIIQWSPDPKMRFKQIKPMMESIAQELGVERHTIVASGSDPL